MKEEDRLLQMILGSTMTQAVLFRFLLKERLIDRERLLTFLEERASVWGKTASDEALLPLAAIRTALQSDEEPSAPKTFH